MNNTPLLADSQALALESLSASDTQVVLVVKAIRSYVPCPRCHQVSCRVHSHYHRTVADLPWQGVSVQLQLLTHRWFCSNQTCSQKIFCERLPKVAAVYGRQTIRLNEALRLTGLILGGEAGAKLAKGFSITISPDTLLQRIRQSQLPAKGTPRVLGVDDFAFRRGNSYGTILVDLEHREVVDLLPNRSAETLTQWLLEHPGVEVVSRDRSKAYTEGARQGVPHAVQVADRWHLLKNLTEAVEQLLAFKYPRLPKMCIAPAEEPEEEVYEPKLFRPSAAWVAWSWKKGYRDVEKLWHDVLSDGSKVLREDFDEFIEQLRAGLKTPLPRKKQKPQPKFQQPTSAKVAQLLVSKPESLSVLECEYLEQLRQEYQEVAEIHDLVQGFAHMVRQRQSGMLDAWLKKALECQWLELQSFAAGLDKDEAVRAAMSSCWSNGQVEGQIHRLKLLKRQMYGRANLDLLKQRVMYAA